LLLKKQKDKARKFKKEEIPKLRYGMIHSLYRDSEGVSIVMNQIERVLNEKLNVPLKNIKYLIGVKLTQAIVSERGYI